MAPLDDVLSIDGNRHVFDRLRELVGSGHAIAFSGAGAAAGLYPVWPELVQLLIGEAVKRGLASDADRATWERFAATRPQQVVRGVRERLGRRVYGAVLRELFGYRNPAHTEIQGLLMRLPFRGHVTTNYDPGLLEARRLLRPDVRATGYATWQDQDALRAWHTGDAFGEHTCPVLYAHGVFERSDTIVLGADDYRDAYRPGLFRELVRKLWSQERLVFVGFGFTDAWFDTVAEEVLGLTREGAGDPRHIAIVGLADGEPYSPELRTMFRDAYDTEVLLYPVVGGDHHALMSVLAELAGPVTAPVPARAPEPSASAARRGAVAGPSRMATASPGVSRLTVFLCHSSSDKPTVRSLYNRLRDDGFLPWLDEMSILPGEDWDRAIRRAIRACQVVLICLSRGSVAKAGYLQKEIRFVLDAADEQPEGTIFLIPARLDDVDVPDRLRRWQWVNLFEEQGYERLVLALRHRAGEWNLT